MAVKKSPRRKARAKKSRSATGFWTGLIASALTTFQIASCSINPAWNAQVQQHLPDLGSISTPAIGQAPAPTSSASTVSTGFAQCRSFFPGQPPVLTHAPSALRELCFSAFAVLHSGQTRTPVVVVEKLSRQGLQKRVPREDNFYPEARLPASERSELADYRGSGYSRGHMAPAADAASPESMAQSFSLANMVPQNQEHNSGPWAKIEEDTRRYVMRASGDVYVFTGPVFDGPAHTIGKGGVAVPSHLFKLVYDPSTGKSWAHWHRNAPGQQAMAPISYSELVRRTGMHLMPALEL